MTAIATAPSQTVDATSPATRRRVRRAAAIVVAAVVSTALVLVGRAAGVDFVMTTPGGTADVDLLTAFSFTAQVGLLGWLVLALLERFAPARAQAIWTGLAVAIVALSEIPVFLIEATTGTRVMLTLIHVAVGVVLIPLMRRR